MAFGIIDTTISDEQFSKLQADLFSSFRIDDTPRLKTDGKGLGRTIPPRAPDPDIAPSGPKAPAKAALVKPSPDVEKRAEVASPAETPREPRAAVSKFNLPPKPQG